MTSETASQRAASLLEEIRVLSELNGENPFKVRAYEKAQLIVTACEDLEKRARAGTLTELEGIGKGISEILTEFVLHGKSTLRDELAARLPPGLLELVKVPGLGPKKARVLIDELGIHTLGELEYACRENRLVKFKGFGEKTQSKILEGIRFLQSTRDQARLVDALPVAERVAAELTRVLGKTAEVREAGALRRRLEVLDRLEFLVVSRGAADASVQKKAAAALKKIREAAPSMLQVDLAFTTEARAGYDWASATGSPEHWKAIGAPKPFDARDEEGFYAKLKLPWIPPEMRETGEEVELARLGKLGGVLAGDGVRGVFHNHTTRSDGTATLEEMVKAAWVLGYRYIGISDHSQSAVYAHGLKTDDLRDQEKEVRKVQERHPDIRIFWGVESDILADGSLDYPESMLKRFDFVIASIHSRFKMDREQMTTRLLKAVRNPYTRFLGHMTGRLLLGRPAYDFDVPAVIAAAAENDVAIEINANPARLDIDWRWGKLLRESRTPVSVNPDAHETAGLEDTAFGVTVARKALLPTELVVNSRSADEVGKWLRRA